MRRRCFIALTALLVACAAPPPLEGVRCTRDTECQPEKGLACFGRCLSASGDFDGDGLANVVERDAGLDALLADTDGDGILDGTETSGVMPDRDGDGRSDALERSDADADRDCIPDDRDRDDATPETNELELRRQCSAYGACVNTFSRQRARCVDGVLSCTLDGQPYPAETCNGVDDDCDSLVDEGCPGGPLTRGRFAAPTRDGDRPGTLVIEKPFALTLPVGGPLPESLRVLELDQVTEVVARCVPREPLAAPPLVRLSVTVPAGLPSSSDAPAVEPAPGPRDARGRPVHLSSAGQLVGAVALDHLAGRWATLTIRCEDTSVVQGTAPLTVVLPVRVSSRAAPSAGGCSTGVGLAPLLALTWALRRRRRGALAAALVFVSGCGTPTSSVTLDATGTGPANVLPLWPMGGEALPSWTDPPVLATGRPLVVGEALASARPVAEGVERRFDRGDARGRPGVGFLEKNGDLFITTGHYGTLEAPLLLVPKTVRVGMRWQGRAKLETDSLRHVLQLPLVPDDGVWTFTVSHRQKVTTRWGPAVLWRIEWAGPPIPHALTATGFADLDQGPGVAQTVPADEVARLRGFVDLVEGSGPADLALHLHALDSFESYQYGRQGRFEPELPRLDADRPTTDVDPMPDPDGAARLVEQAFPPLLDDAGVLLRLASAEPQAAPVLKLSAASMGPLGEGGGLSSTETWFTRSTKEPSGSLVLFGVAAQMNNLIDPTGGQTQVYFPVPAVGCTDLTVDGQVAGAPPSDQCPDRIDRAARPWVNPDGSRWDTTSISSVIERGLAQTPQNLYPSGFEPDAPFWADGGFHVVGRDVNRSGDATPPGLRSFGTVPTEDLLDFPSTAGDTVPGTPRFGLSQGTAEATRIMFAEPLGDRIALVRAAQPLSILRDKPGSIPMSEVTWLDWTGQPQARVPLLTSRPGWTHVDGTHVLTEVGQAGELRRVHVEPTRVWAELLGYLDVPAGHAAATAVLLSDDRYFIVTHASPELRITGWAQRKVWPNNLEQVEPRSGPLYGFTVTAPPTGLVDHAWALRQVTAQLGDGVVRACVPPGLELTIDELRVGGAVRPLRPRGARCWDAAVEAEDVQRSVAAGWTPVALHVAGHGWLRRRLAALRTTSSLPAEPFATLADGSRRYPSALVAPYAAERQPVSTRLPMLDGAYLGNDGERLTRIPDASGGGLWVTGNTTYLFPRRCTAQPCLDEPYAPATLPTGRTEPYALLAATRNHVYWAPPGPVVGASTGGLVGPGWHLAPDGTFTTLPGDPGRRSRFAELTWLFLDGRWCGRLTTAEGGGFGCIDAAGTRQRLTLPDAALGPFTAQEPGFLVRGALTGGLFFVDVIDVRTGTAQRLMVGSATASSLSGPTLGTDGTLWWLLGGASPQRVGVRGGALEVHPAPVGEAALWGASADTVWWASGQQTTRAPSNGCVPQAERCNGSDDDCDGEVDEDGAIACAAPNATRRCEQGACVTDACAAGFADCNGVGGDGCEAALGSVAHCARCGDACQAGGTCTGGVCVAPPPPDLAGGGTFVCARHAPGEAHCLAGPWPLTAPPNFPDRLQRPAVDVEELATGDTHACVRWRDGGVGCWGQTDVALGPQGAYFSVQDRPVPITGLGGPAVALWAGGLSTCVRRADGQLWCWGPVVTGLRAPASPSDVDVYFALREPTHVAGLEGVNALALSGDRGCAVLGDGGVSCFGPTDAGTFVTTPLALPAASTRVFGASAVRSGAGTFVTEAGGLMYGLGALQSLTVLGGPGAGPWVTPQRLPGLDGAREVVIGPAHLCVLAATETRCAGVNTTGQLGRPENAGIFSSWVTHPTTFLRGAATADSTCFVASAGSISCAGRLVEVSGYSPRSTLTVVPVRAP